MDVVTAFIARVRDHYVEQFTAFADEQKQGCETGASEVKLQLSEQSELYQRLYCVDFLRNENGQARPVELLPDRFLRFDTISGSFGAARLVIEHLRWDDVTIYHDLTLLPSEAMADWFEHWFDPDDRRLDQSAQLSGIVHSLLIKPGVIHVDFGTAPPEAFWGILDALERAGATSIRVSSSRAESGDQGTPI
jgi:hypothetical protein